MLIRSRVTTQLVPHHDIAIAQSGYYLCQCGTHGHAILSNGMQLAEHIAKKTAYSDIERLCFSGFVKGELGPRMRAAIATASVLADSESTVHPDIIRKIREWNALREANQSPYPGDPHAFIFGGSGFHPRAFPIAKTVPLTSEPEDYRIVNETELESALAFVDKTP